MANDTGKKWAAMLPYVKYSKWAPVFFYYDKKVESRRFDDLDGLKLDLGAGDILLRRYDNYLDGLILSQNSYFTHIGIYEGNGTVIHALGKGIVWESIDTFARCDDIAVLRFDYDKLKVYQPQGNPSQEMLLPNGSINQTSVLYAPQNKINVRTIINNTIENSPPVIRVAHQAVLDVYDSICCSVKKKWPSLDDIRDLVLEAGRNCKGKKYDFLFDFADTRAFSCIEFAWYCYVFLFPVHQMARKTKRFFGIVKTKIVVPDSFLENGFFKLVYHPSEVDKQVLIDSTKKKYLCFWLHFLHMMAAQILLSALVMGLAWLIELCVLHYQ